MLFQRFYFCTRSHFFLVLDDLKDVNMVDPKVDISINIFATVSHG